MTSPGQDNPAYGYGKESDAAPPPAYAPHYPAGAYPMPPMQPAGAYNPAQPQAPYAYPAQTTVVVQQAQARPQDYMAMSCVVYWCCNWLFGGIAFALSLASSSAADDNDMEKARRLGKASMWVNVAGIIITIVVVAIVLILYFVVLANAINENNGDIYYN